MRAGAAAVAGYERKLRDPRAVHTLGRPRWLREWRQRWGCEGPWAAAEGVSDHTSIRAVASPTELEEPLTESSENVEPFGMSGDGLSEFEQAIVGGANRSESRSGAIWSRVRMTAIARLRASGMGADEFEVGFEWRAEWRLHERIRSIPPQREGPGKSVASAAGIREATCFRSGCTGHWERMTSISPER